MGSSSQGIALEQLGQDHTGLAIGNASGAQIYSSSNGITAQIDSAKKTYDVLNCLFQVLSPAHSLDTLLHSLADLTRQVMQMDLCVVMLVDPAFGSLTMRAASPDLTNYELSVTPIASDRIPWKKLLKSRLYAGRPDFTEVYHKSGSSGNSESPTRAYTRTQ